MLAWKLGTELLRPLVGQPNYQFVERAGDYVLPLALFWLVKYRLLAVRAPDADAGHVEHRAEKEAQPVGVLQLTYMVRITEGAAPGTAFMKAAVMYSDTDELLADNNGASATTTTPSCTMWQT